MPTIDCDDETVESDPELSPEGASVETVLDEDGFNMLDALAVAMNLALPHM